MGNDSILIEFWYWSVFTLGQLQNSELIKTIHRCPKGISWFVIEILFECDVRTRLLKIRVGQWLCFIEFEVSFVYGCVATLPKFNTEHFIHVLYSIILYIYNSIIYMFAIDFLLILLGEIYATTNHQSNPNCYFSLISYRRKTFLFDHCKLYFCDALQAYSK